MDSDTNEDTTPPTNEGERSSTAAAAGPSREIRRVRPIERKLLSGKVGASPVDESVDPDTWRPEWLFFYGSLMDAQQLRKVLRLQETPTLQTASIGGWEVNIVDKKEHIKSLQDYETDSYKLQACCITFKNDTDEVGKTFIWNLGKELLKDGKFDLKDLRMAQLDE